MATITKTDRSRAANPISFAAASGGGDEFVNTGSEILFVSHTNGAGSAVTLTIVTQATVDGLAVADRTVVIDPGEFHPLGPFDTKQYNDANGKVQLTWSSATDIEIAVLN